MTTLEPELQALTENIFEMVDLTRDQLNKCKKAISKVDTDIAKDVINTEKRLNQLELSVERDCENILALHNPVAVDLRFVLACLKISNDLERIGDNAEALAKVLVAELHKDSVPFIEKFKLTEMLDLSLVMLKEIAVAMEQEDTKLAKKVFKKDSKLDARDKEALKVASKLIKDNPKQSELVLKLFAMTRRLERVGDLIKNIAEEIVFYVDAKVLKHKKQKA